MSQVYYLVMGHPDYMQRLDDFSAFLEEQSKVKGWSLATSGKLDAQFYFTDKDGKTHLVQIKMDDNGKITSKVIQR